MAGWRGAAWALAFLLAWTAYGAVSSATMAVHGDVAEAYVWGQQLELGYAKHPPFWAWVAGLWFRVLPAANGSFAALAVANALVGLVGCARLIGALTAGPRRDAALWLLLATPFYTFMALKFNANSIFLSLYPWAAYLLLRSLQTRRALDAAALGLVFAACLLSKYYAAILLLTLGLAALVSPHARAYLRSWAPWVTVAVTAVAVSPHLWWLTRHPQNPVTYFAGKGGLAPADALANSVMFALGVLAYHAVVIGMVLLYRRRGRLAGTWTDSGEAFHGWDRFLAVVVLAPPILTVAASLGAGVKISTNMTLAVFPLAPLFVMRLAGKLDEAGLAAAARVFALAVTGGALLLSPLVAYAKVRWGDEPGYRMPQKELAAALTREWRAAAGTRLPIVAGSDLYAGAVSVYSPDHPAQFINFSVQEAPWIRPGRLAHEGWAAVCRQGDAVCARQLRPWLAGAPLRRRITVRHEAWGVARRAETFDAYLFLPRR